MSLGKIIIIVAPSGTGKSTLIELLRKDYPQLQWSISSTTRPQREGEVDGVHYNFSTTESFKERIEAGEFLEWAIVHGNYYGTSKKFIDSKINEGVNLILEVDIQGADACQKQFPDLTKVIFIAPPSIETLKERLQERGTDSVETIDLRLENAQRELLRQNDYDFLVKNDVLDKAYVELKEIVGEIIY